MSKMEDLAAELANLDTMIALAIEQFTLTRRRDIGRKLAGYVSARDAVLSELAGMLG